jgi:hypothetical protein
VVLITLQRQVLGYHHESRNFGGRIGSRRGEGGGAPLHREVSRPCIGDAKQNPLLGPAEHRQKFVSCLDVFFDRNIAVWKVRRRIHITVTLLHIALRLMKSIV